MSGLEGLVDETAPVVDSGVTQDGDEWLVAWDQRSAGVGAPPMEGLLAGATGAVVLACGDHDQMVSPAQLSELRSGMEVVADRGHNVHVEDPRSVWSSLPGTSCELSGAPLSR